MGSVSVWTSTTGTMRLGSRTTDTMHKVFNLSDGTNSFTSEVEQYQQLGNTQVSTLLAQTAAMVNESVTLGRLTNASL